MTAKVTKYKKNSDESIIIVATINIWLDFRYNGFIIEFYSTSMTIELPMKRLKIRHGCSGSQMLADGSAALLEEDSPQWDIDVSRPKEVLDLMDMIIHDPDSIRFKGRPLTYSDFEITSD